KTRKKMFKQNYNNREVLVFERYEIGALAKYLKPEYEKRKKAFEKVKKQYDAKNNAPTLVINDEFRKLREKYNEMRNDFESLRIWVDYFERFSISYPWETQP
ncbi:MAG: hypothetical protein J6U21_04705, partial [Bacteroidales bacterium]|nr:hypothetical protein [Bacteroidales bacterium]